MIKDFGDYVKEVSEQFQILRDSGCDTNSAFGIIQFACQLYNTDNINTNVAMKLQEQKEGEEWVDQ